MLEQPHPALDSVLRQGLTKLLLWSLGLSLPSAGIKSCVGKPGSTVHLTHSAHLSWNQPCVAAESPFVVSDCHNGRLSFHSQPSMSYTEWQHSVTTLEKGLNHTSLPLTPSCWSFPNDLGVKVVKICSSLSIEAALRVHLDSTYLMIRFYYSLPNKAPAASQKPCFQISALPLVTDVSTGKLFSSLMLVIPYKLG